VANDARVAARHALLRWLGAPLLLTGLGLAGWAIYAAMVGGSGWTVAFGMLGAGLALASFGANHDTAMALAYRARDVELAPSLRQELSDELERDRDDIIGLTPMPKMAIVMPLIALGLQSYVLYRLLGWNG